MTWRLVLTCSATLALSACVAAGPPMRPLPAPSSSAFNARDFAWSTVPGKASVNGQLTYRPNGRRHSCEAAGVLLTPETPWVRARMRILYGSNDRAILPATEVRSRTPSEKSQDYSTFVRRARCDGNGRFSFSGLPDGNWYLITVARPQPAGGFPDMAVMRRVETRGGKAVALSL